MGARGLVRGLRRPSRPDPVPLETGRRAVIVTGTALWTVALVGLLAARALGQDVHGWWIGTAAYGAGLGLLGVRYVTRLRPGP